MCGSATDPIALLVDIGQPCGPSETALITAPCIGLRVRCTPSPKGPHMSLTPLDPQAIRAAAQAALDARLGLIDAIVAAQNERTVAASKVSEAQAAERAAAATELSAIKAAVDGGWSVPELRKAGLKVPASAATGKKSTAAASVKTSPRPPRLQPSSTPANNGNDAPESTGTDAEQNSSGESYANAS